MFAAFVKIRRVTCHTSWIIREHTLETTSNVTLCPTGCWQAPLKLTSLDTHCPDLRNLQADSRAGSSSFVERPHTPMRQRKMYVCSVCEYKTCYLSHFMDHKRTHTGDHIKCHLCPRTFAGRSNYSSHMKAHAGLLVCTICGKGYSSRIGLIRHQGTHNIHACISPCVH
ncbi:histone-lysine N-methyltransferase PRDM9-like [Gigantopelta aegis]|uniref:histone-lysine N-methyltransferase PRDM9-like n=1 Tax=Gigantopelta aegis TaxID=1735272 RepID=UPI001B8878E6|nr:histone-lysine N-methyltransferase PRDM9-like [Gigantopelta aegis]